MKSFTLALFVANCYGFDLDATFADFMTTHGKSYATKEEFMFRKAIFNERDHRIRNWNSEKGHSHKLGHNKFSDWTEEEFGKIMGVRKGTKKESHAEERWMTTDSLPTSWDWRNTKDVVGPVGNQMNCISGWAFAGVHSIESAHTIKTGEYIKLSEQQCIDCAVSSYGCSGAETGLCFEYASTV